ncbi:MAG: tetratricopeptide repeat protein [Cyanobacteria bacterium J06554_11]
MRPLEPVRPDSIQRPETQSVSKAVRKLIGNAKVPARSAHRFRADSWLSSEDANLLLRKRAQLEAKQENYAAALKVLNQLTAYEPENADNYANRGLMHYHLRQCEQALADYNRAIELNPELDKAYSNRANLHATQQNWNDAIADYDHAIDLNPLNIRARLNQAITLREMGDCEEALVCLDIAMFFRPQSATLYAERGRTYHLQGHWNCALSDYNKALELTQDQSLKDISSRARVSRRVLKWMQALG